MSWTPLACSPVKFDWNNTSTQRKRSAPLMMMFSSGSSKVLKVHTGYLHTGGATTLISSSDGTNFSTQWKHSAPTEMMFLSGNSKVFVVSLDNTALTYGLLAGVHVTLHVALERSVVESAGFFANDTWMEKHFRSTETFGPIKDDVSVWELVGLILLDFRRRFELCVVIGDKKAQFLADIPSNIQLCGGSERANFIKFSVRSRPAKSKRRTA